MVKIGKILCLLFILLIIYVLYQKCSIEGFDGNSFTNCIDDPNWYTVDESGRKLYCSNIGQSASCYDRSPGQLEGWERCLQTCGNCSDTIVTTADMSNLATYSGDPIEDFGVVMFVDDDRKWFGMGVGEEVTNEDGETELVGDIRSIGGSLDEGDDIENLFDRVSIIEDLYDMLLGSVNSCIDCSIHNETECENIEGCELGESGLCQTIELEGDDTFIGCNGSELSCIYTIETNDDDADSDEVDSDEVDSDGLPVDRNTIVRQYVRHVCDDNGQCNLQFPTYEFSCEGIPEPPGAFDNRMIITYNPSELESCTNLDNISDINSTCSNVTESTETFTTSGYSISSTSESGQSDTIIISDTDFSNGLIQGDSLTFTGIGCPTGPFTISTRNPDNSGNISVVLTGADLDQDIQGICSLTKEVTTESIEEIQNCYRLTNDNDTEACANYCGDNDPSNSHFIIKDDTECYCINDTYTELTYDSGCASDTYQVYSDGQTVENNRIQVTDGTSDEAWNEMCKSYFLLEKTLTGSSISDSDDQLDDPLYQRVSLYDICPTQCKAPTCATD